MNEMILFQDKKVRRIWNESNQKWYFSIIDVVEVLTESNRPRKYWNDLKSKLKNEGSELSEKIGQLKMPSSDGKFYDTDVAAATTEIAKKKDAQGLPENKKAAIEGGTMNESEKKLRKRDQFLSDAFKGGDKLSLPLELNLIPLVEDRFMIGGLMENSVSSILEHTKNEGNLWVN